MSKFENKTNKISTSTAIAMSAGALSLVLSAGTALSAPVGGNIVGGQGAIDQSKVGETHITQDSNRLAVDWQSFDVNQNELVQFHQPGANSIALNRVVGSLDPSRIMGTLKANGQVILINPNGLYFGKNSVVDVAGLVGTTTNITNRNFMNGNMKFDQAGNKNAQIINDGSISTNAKENGLAALVAPSVVNNGVIAAKLGKVQLASADTFVIDPYGDGLINFEVGADNNSRDIKAGVTNTGEINADGGTVYLTAKTASNVLDNVINLEGKISANTIESKNGEIILGAGSGTANVSGTIEARGNKSGEKGGKVQVTGNNVNIKSGAKIDASGNAGGGKVLIGGDFQGKNQNVQNAQNTTIEKGAEINVSATENGDAGKAIVWADGNTDYKGKISAEGGSKAGNGGFVEVSGKENLGFNGEVKLSAKAEGYDNGTLLLDPKNITITLLSSIPADSAELADGAILAGDRTGEDLFIDFYSLGEAFGSGDVLLTADENITFSSDFIGGIFFGTNTLSLVSDTVNLNSNFFTNGTINITANTLNLAQNFTSFQTGEYANVITSGTANVNVLNTGVNINKAISYVADNGEVNLASGTYFQSVFIDRDITLSGAGDEGDNRTIIAGGREKNTFSTSYDETEVEAIILVQDTDNANIENLAVEAESFEIEESESEGFEEQPQLAIEPTEIQDKYFAGIAYDNAGGTVDNVSVVNTAEKIGTTDYSFNNEVEQESEIIETFGILADSDSNHNDSTRELIVNNSKISEYGTAGILFNGDKISGEITNNQITGDEFQSIIKTLKDESHDSLIIGSSDDGGITGIAVTDLKQELELDSEDTATSFSNVSAIEAPETEAANIIVSNNTISESLNGVSLFSVDDVEVSNNTINGAAIGILAADATNIDILDNDLYGSYTQNSFGVAAIGSSNFNVKDNFINGYWDGITSINGTNNSFDTNWLYDNYNTAINLIGETNAAVKTNYIQGYNLELGGEPGYFYGVKLTNSTNTNVNENDIYGTDTGVAVLGTSSKTTVQNNLIDGSYTGVEVNTTGNETAVKGNDIYAYGESVQQGFDRQAIGINVVDSGSDVTLTDNFINYTYKNSYNECYLSDVCHPTISSAGNASHDSNDYSDLMGPDIGINIENTAGVVTSLNEIENFTHGIVAVKSDNGVITNNDIYLSDTNYKDNLVSTNVSATVVDEEEVDQDDMYFEQDLMYSSNGITVYKSDDTQVSSNTVENYRTGIYGSISDGLDIDGNTIQYKDYSQEDSAELINREAITGFVVSGGTGIYVDESSDVTINNNTVKNNYAGISITETLGLTATNNKLSENLVYGIVASNTSDILVDKNTVSDSFTGIDATTYMSYFSDENISTTGVISNNIVSAINEGIYAAGSNTNVDITDNTITITGGSGYYFNSQNDSAFSPLAFGIVVEDFADSSITGNSITFNSATGNQNSAGIILANAAADINIDDNIINLATGYGSGVEINGTQGVTMGRNNINGGLVGLKLTNGYKLADDSIDNKSFESEMALSADVTFTDTNTFTGNEFYIALNEGIMTDKVLDASGSIFDGVRGSDMSNEQITAAEDKTVDIEDFSPVDRGDVFYNNFTSGLSSANDQVNQQENTSFRNLFSYAGNTIGVNGLEGRPSFDSLNLNLSLLSSSGSTFGGINFANLAPAAGGGDGDDSSCGNSFLSGGFAPSFNTSSCQ